MTVSQILRAAAERKGVRRECSRCWAHPATARLCYCDDEKSENESPAPNAAADVEGK